MAVDKKLKELTKFCRESGISSLKIGQSGEIDVSFFPSAAFPQKKSTEPTGDNIENLNQFTEEDALFWSSTPLPHDNAEQ